MRRALGIVRVSQVGGREGESFASPGEQRDRIAAACERDGLELLRTVEELDVSGGTPLEKRHGLRGAVEAVEAGEAEVIVAAYFDRLVRSLKVQEEVVSRVEAAGGGVMAVDIGAVSGETASQWVVGTFLGAVAEYQRRATRERAGAAQARAVARGVLPHPGIPPGYERAVDGKLVPTQSAGTVQRAFKLRAQQTTLRDVRAFLRSHGIERSYHGVQSLLSNRIYLGEIHFGKLVNLEAHEPIIDRDLFERVQRVKVPRGRRPQSDRLLARLGILRCGTCGARMVVGVQTQAQRGGIGRKAYPFYRCPPVGDCPRRQTISATTAEEVVVQAVRHELAEVEGKASAEREAREAADRVERAQLDLDRAIRVLDDLGDEPAARDKLIHLRDIREHAVAEAHRLGSLHSALTVNIAARWDDLTLAEKREAIRLTVARAVVGPGKGAGRITVHLLSEHPPSD